MSLKILLGSVALGIAFVTGAYFTITPRVSDTPGTFVEKDIVEEYTEEREDTEEIEIEEDDLKGETPAQGAPSGYTEAEVATHASEASCWTIINGSVYDVTAWIPKHPGGERNILRLCGIDGTSLFEGKHGGGAKQEAVLATFRIGDLI